MVIKLSNKEQKRYNRKEDRRRRKAYHCNLYTKKYKNPKLKELARQAHYGNIF